MLDFKIDKTKDCIVIDTDDWKQGSSLLKRYKMSGRSVVTYITEVVDKNIISKKFKDANSVLEKGSLVLISRIASEISKDRGYNIENKKYYHIPIMQVLGYFNDTRFTLDSLNLLYDKVLVEKIDSSLDQSLIIPDCKSMIGRILKVGTNKFDSNWNKVPLTVTVGDTVLIKDNVSTKVTFEGKEYFVVEENSIIGIFKDKGNLTLDNLKVINNYIILKEFIDEKLLGSDVLSTPLLDYASLDETDIYNMNTFKVEGIDETIKEINKYDVIIADRSMTSYAYLNTDKFFALTGTFYVDAKIR